MKKFEGYYVKCTNEETIAFIVGRQVSGKESSSFMQVITKEKTYYQEFSASDFLFAKKEFMIKVGENYVNRKQIHINMPKYNIAGDIFFDSFTKIKYNAMGPLKYLPFLECSHFVVSMEHSLKGKMLIEGREINFDEGIGYIEGDKGKSFPKKYFWSQANKNGISVFSSAATIPYLGMQLKGTVNIIQLNGREIRLATYLGARVRIFTENKLVIQQRKLRLEIEVLNAVKHPLKAPVCGSMSRIIHESVSAVVRYQLTKGNNVLMHFISTTAGAEYSDQS